MLIRGQDRFGHFGADTPAQEWLPDDAQKRLLVSTRKYHAITGPRTPPDRHERS